MVLPDVIIGPARATVTSVAGVAPEVVGVAVYVGFAATSGLVPVPVQVATLGVPLAVVALLARRSLPPSPDGGRPVGGAALPRRLLAWPG